MGPEKKFWMAICAARPIQPSDFDRANVGAILEEIPPCREFTHFSAQLMRLIKRADLDQREVLRAVYPDHVAAVEGFETGAVPSPTGGGVSPTAAVGEMGEID